LRGLAGAAQLRPSLGSSVSSATSDLRRPGAVIIDAASQEISSFCTLWLSFMLTRQGGTAIVHALRCAHMIA